MPVKTRGRAKREHESNRVKAALDVAKAKAADARVLRLAVLNGWQSEGACSNYFEPMPEFPCFSMATASFEALVIQHPSLLLGD